MKVLIVGSGGREHALAWAASRSALAPEVFALPGNPGIAEVGTCLPGSASDCAAIRAVVAEREIDFVLIGPEAPLVAGLADELRAAGVRAFGPSAAAAAIEGSKVFAKELMARHRIPTAAFEVADDPPRARALAETIRLPHVIKADGLAAGKGALIARDREEARAAVEALMVTRQFGEAGRRIVFEEYLEGEEMSVFAIAAGEDYTLLPPSQDYKRVGEGDRGLNTGGMGAYAPVVGWNAELEARVRETILAPTLHALAAVGRPYQGLLYAGLMITRDGPQVIEFNCRFGDPETQAVVPILKGDLLATLWAASDPNRGGGPLPELGHDGRSALCLVIASGGYPGAVRRGLPIEGHAAAARSPGVTLFQAGTARAGTQLRTAGGRVLDLVGVGPDLPAARAHAYAAAGEISFAGAFFRRDIAWRGLQALEGPRTQHVNGR